MKKKLLLALSLCIALGMFAQKNVSAKWGPTYKTKARLSGIIGEDKAGFYTTRINRKGDVWLERYDTKMNLKFSEELLIPKKGKKSLVTKGFTICRANCCCWHLSMIKKQVKAMPLPIRLTTKVLLGQNLKN